MSLLIGNTPTGPVIHATVNTAGEDAMVAGIIEGNTFFHSDLPFASYTRHEVQPIGNPGNDIHIYSSQNTAYSVDCAELANYETTLGGPALIGFLAYVPSFSIDILNPNKLAVLVVEGRAVSYAYDLGLLVEHLYNGIRPLNAATYWLPGENLAYPRYFHEDISMFKSASNPALFIPYLVDAQESFSKYYYGENDQLLSVQTINGRVPTSMYILEIDVDIDNGHIPPTTGGVPGLVIDGDDGVTINGYSLFNYSYLNTVQMAPNDEAVEISPNLTVYQAGNTEYDTSSPVTIESTAERTFFKKGDYYLFDSNYPYQSIKYKGFYSSTFTHSIVQTKTGEYYRAVSWYQCEPTDIIFYYIKIEILQVSVIDPISIPEVGDVYEYHGLAQGDYVDYSTFATFNDYTDMRKLASLPYMPGNFKLYSAYDIWYGLKSPDGLSQYIKVRFNPEVGNYGGDVKVTLKFVYFNK